MDVEQLSPFPETMSALVYLTTNAKRSESGMNGCETVSKSTLEGGGFWVYFAKNMGILS